MSNPQQQARMDGVAWCYEHMGASFVPLRGKRPVDAGWQSRPRESRDEAMGWAAEGNIGIRTGQASGGIVIIDVDPGGDVSKLDLPPTVQAITGRGGYHHYFRASKPVHNRAGKLGEHIDVRGDGGQAVFPGSIHPDTHAVYQWVAGCEPWAREIAALPDRLYALLESSPPPKPAARPRVLTGSRYVRLAFQAEVNAVATAAEGTRNDTLNKAAFSLGQFVGGGHLGRAEVEADLLAAARGVGLGESEARQTIASGIDAGSKEPRHPPEPEKGKAKSADPPPQRAGMVRLGDIDPETGRIVLSPKRTLPTAEAFVAKFHQHAAGRTLHHYAGTFWEWRGNAYRPIDDLMIRRSLMYWLHDALRYVYNAGRGEFSLSDFESNPTTVSAALDSVRALVALPDNILPPLWLDDSQDGPAAAELLTARTITLHLPTGERLDPTPALFNTAALEYDPDPAATAPRWLGFMDELFGEDRQSVELLQDWFGYCLTPDTSQHKMLYIFGPRRSGKGTIGRVLRKLLGEHNVCAPTLDGLGKGFGMASVLGKTLALVGDARFTGNTGEAVERLLRISGEDAVTVERKYEQPMTVRVPCRFMFLSNELPRLRDTSAALAGRWVFLKLTTSFFGREDKELEGKLMAELPGILNWAIEGWHRMRERGRFVQPDAVEGAVEEVEELTSPILGFVHERCEVAPGKREYVQTLFEAWTKWCKASGWEHPGTIQSFGRDLQAAVSGIAVRRNHAAGRFYEGIDLIPECPV